MAEIPKPYEYPFELSDSELLPLLDDSFREMIVQKKTARTKKRLKENEKK